MKKLSVLIPVYGVEKYIKKFATTLFNNTIIDDCEIIFVNDCTKDRSIEILKSLLINYPSLDVKIIPHETNQGLAAARNTGLKNATCDYVIFLDSDDWVEPDLLEKLYNKAVENNCDIVTCGFYYEKKWSRKKQKQITADTNEENYKLLLLDEIKGFLWCKLFRRSLFTQNNITWKPGLNMWEDFYIDSRLFFYANKFAYINECLYHYRITNTSSITKSKDIKHFINQMNVFREIVLFLHEKNAYKQYLKELQIRYLREKLFFPFSYGTNMSYITTAISNNEWNYYRSNQKILFRKLTIKRRIFLYFLSRKHYSIGYVLFLLWKTIKHKNFNQIDYKYVIEEIRNINFILQL